MVRKIVVMNKKGGVAKTTTAVNIAVGLAQKFRKVLLIDLDEQSNVADHLNIQHENSTADVLTLQKEPQECVKPNIRKYRSKKYPKKIGRLDVIIADESLEEVPDNWHEMKIPLNKQHTILKTAMKPIEEYYDYIIVDCPPTNSKLNKVALAFSTEVLIPFQPESFSVKGIIRLIQTVKKWSEQMKMQFKLKYLVPTMWSRMNVKYQKEMREKLTQVKNIEKYLTHPIRVNVKIKEASAKGTSIFDHEKELYTKKEIKDMKGSLDYMAVVKKIIADETKEV